MSIKFFHFYHESFELPLLKIPSIYDLLLLSNNSKNTSFVVPLTSDDPSIIIWLITFTNFEFYFKNWHLYSYFYRILSTQRAALAFTAGAFELLFAIIMGIILVELQYVQRDTIHFLAYSTIKELASCTFLNNLVKSDYR